MISLEQLQQLKELVHITVGQVHILTQENAQLRQKLLEYENNMDRLARENRNLVQQQELVEAEFKELLHELQKLTIEVVEPTQESEAQQIAAEEVMPEEPEHKEPAETASAEQKWQGQEEISQVYNDSKDGMGLDTTATNLDNQELDFPESAHKVAEPHN